MALRVVRAVYDETNATPEDILTAFSSSSVPNQHHSECVCVCVCFVQMLAHIMHSTNHRRCFRSNASVIDTKSCTAVGDPCGIVTCFVCEMFVHFASFAMPVWRGAF